MKMGVYCPVDYVVGSLKKKHPSVFENFGLHGFLMEIIDTLSENGGLWLSRNNNDQLVLVNKDMPISVLKNIGDERRWANLWSIFTRSSGGGF